MKIDIITGAGKGIGKSISEELAKLNFSVALVSRTEKDLIKLKNKIQNSDYFVCDIRSAKQVEDTVNKIVEKFGKIDVLVNNAGVWISKPTRNYRRRI